MAASRESHRCLGQFEKFLAERGARSPSTHEAPRPDALAARLQTTCGFLDLPGYMRKALGMSMLDHFCSKADRRRVDAFLQIVRVRIPSVIKIGF